MLIIGIILFFRTFSREKEIAQRIQEVSETLKTLSKEIKDTREKQKDLEIEIAKNYLSVERWLEINNKFEAAIKNEFRRIDDSLRDLQKILIEVLKDGKAS